MNVMNDIICGDCIEVMCDIDSDRVDCIVSDPPYQLSSPNTKNVTKGFMGKSWDICPNVETWQECLRVLKPGAFAFVMCIPRQDCLARMICRLEDAGFNIGFSSIYHTFATGFPKAQNLSKKADPQVGVEREIIGKGKSGKTAIWQKDGNMGDFNITKSTSSQAKALEGSYSGFQPKPAVEVVIVAMKPLEEKTYVDQALKNGHGCTWLDDARIPILSSDNLIGLKEPYKHITTPGGIFKPGENGTTSHYNIKGRFPANVICEDDVLDDGIERKSGGKKGLCHESKLWDNLDTRSGTNISNRSHQDFGSFSRYFSLDAWFAERIKLLPKEAQKTFPWLIVPKASKNEKNRGLESTEEKQIERIQQLPDGFVSSYGNIRNKPAPQHNFHATVKPIKLMSWLITLASREGDLVLDPFCGSGTTCIAAKMIGRHYIGIEKEAEYCEIARKRISAITEGLSRFM